MPSGNKVLGSVWSTHMDLLIYVSERMPTEGLCGSFDGNPDNDIVVRGTESFPGFIPPGPRDSYVVYSNVSTDWW